MWIRWSLARLSARPLRVRTYLASHYLSMLVPLMIAFVVLAGQFMQQKEELEKKLLVQAERLQAAVDDELLKKVEVMRTMAVSPVIEKGADALFHSWSNEVAKTVGGLNFILLREKKQAVNSWVPLGEPLPPALLPDTQERYDRLVRGETDAEFGFIQGPIAKRWVIILLIKVPDTAGATGRVLAFNLDPYAMHERIAQLDLLPTQVGLLLDPTARIIVRTADNAAYVGQMLSSDFGNIVAGNSKSGIWQGRGINGATIVTAYTRSPLTGWVTQVSLSDADFYAPAYRSRLLVCAALALVVLAGLLQIVIGYIFERSIVGLKDIAVQFSRGEDIVLVEQPVREVNEVGVLFARAAMHRQTILKELNHRVKNMLTKVQALVMRTFRETAKKHGKSPVLDEAKASILEQIITLAQVHDLLSQKNFVEAELREVLEAECFPLYRSQVALSGPPITLSAQLVETFSLVVHELLTNAVKYGALKNPEGTICISWEVAGALRLTWVERGGPRLDSAAKQGGFGTILINRVVVDELRGVLEPFYDPEGLTVVITVPLPRITPA